MIRMPSIRAFALCALALFSAVSVAASAATPPTRAVSAKIVVPPPPPNPPSGGGGVVALGQGPDWILLTVPGTGTTAVEEEPVDTTICPPWGCPVPEPVTPPDGEGEITPPPPGDPGTDSNQHVYVLHGQLGVVESPLVQSLKDDLLQDDGGGTIVDLNATEEEPLYIVRQDIAEALAASEASGVLAPELAALSERIPVTQSSCDMKEHTLRRFIPLTGHNFNKSYPLGGGFTGSFGVSGNIEGAVTVEVNWWEKRRHFLTWCVPYAAKLKDVHVFGDATANAGATVSGTIAYEHHFGPVELAKPELFSVLFFVGPVPVYIGFNLPIAAGLDLTASGTGSLTYNGSRVVSGTFDWVCNLDECHGDGGFDNEVANTTQTLTGGVSGHLKPEPYVNVGFRAYLYTEWVAYLQAGLQPRLLGDLWGYSGNNCGDADGDGTFESVHALTFDLDWRVDLTGEASALGQGPWRRTLKTGSASHIGFYDLGSNAMQPELLGPSSGRVGTPGEYLVKIRPCWPYDKNVTYRVNWGDGSADTEQETSPAAYARFNHTWSAAGSPTVTATSVKDKHGRALNQSTARSVQVVSCTVPAFSAQPQPASIVAGNSATLSVAANVATFQWYRGSSGDVLNPISGGTGASIVVTPASTTSYWVRAFGPCGDATDSAIATVTVTAVCAVDGTACGGDGNHTCQGGQCVCTNCASGVCCGASGNSYCDGQAHTDPNTGYAGACASTLPGCSAASDFNGGNALYHAGDILACVKNSGAYQWMPRRPSPRCQEVSPVCGFVCSTHYNNGNGFQCDSSGNWNPNAPLPACSLSLPAGWSCVTCVAPQITSQPQPANVQEGQSATLQVQASGTSPTFQWYLGGSGDTSNPVPGGTGASLAVAPSTSVSYWVRVSNACGQTNSQTVTVTVTPACQPPYIAGQPQSVSIFPGATATLSVSAGGTSLAYQWYTSAGSPVAGGTGATLFVSPSSSTSYWVKVSNACGLVNSNTATVTVTCGPNGTACGGDGHHTCQNGQCACTDCGSGVCCGASGNSYCDGQAHTDPNTGYAGACASTLPGCSAASDFNGGNALYHAGDIVACVKNSGAYQWMPRRPSPRCQEVSPVCGFVCSTHYNNGNGFQCDSSGNWNPNAPLPACSLSLPAGWSCVTCVAPQITSQPQPTNIQEGQSATLQVQASGTSPTFQWYLGGSGDTSSPVPGGTGASLVIAPSTSSSYWVRASNACGQTSSQTVTVTVTPACQPPYIAGQPQSVSIFPGATATLSVSAGGTSLAYQWYTSAGSPVAGGTGATLFVSPSSSTSYWVQVWNACGAVNSSLATVTVTCGPNGAACGGDGHHTCQSGQCACTDCGSPTCCGASGNPFCDGQSHFDPNTGYTGVCTSSLPGCAAGNDFDGSNNVYHDGDLLACVKRNGAYTWTARRPSPRCQEVSSVCDYLCANHFIGGAGFQCDQNGNWSQSPLPYCSGGTVPASYLCP